MVARFIVIFLESDKGDEEGRFYLNTLDLQEEMGGVVPYHRRLNKVDFTRKWSDEGHL